MVSRPEYEHEYEQEHQIGSDCEGAMLYARRPPTTNRVMAP